MNGIKLFLCGDVMTGRGIDQILPSACDPGLYEGYLESARDYVALAERAHGPIPPRVDYAYIWGDALAALDNAQPRVRIINLETSVTTSEAAWPKGINYRMHPDNVAVLTAARIDCCVLANNHVLDWGQPGLLETLDALRTAGIRVAGAGTDVHEASAPAVVAVSASARVLVFAFSGPDSGVPESWAAGATTPGVHFLPDFSRQSSEYVARLVRTWKRAGDIAVASVHWGSNWGYDIPREHRLFAHALVDEAGIDIVHGHSSHHPRAIEIYRKRPIFYGCGDFISDYEGISGHDEYRDDLVLMYLPTLRADSGELIRLEMRPLQIRRFRLSIPSTADEAWLFATMSHECERFGGRLVREGDVFVLAT